MDYKEVLQLLNAGYTKGEIDTMMKIDEKTSDEVPTLEPSAAEAETAPEVVEELPAHESAEQNDETGRYKEFAETMAEMRESMNIMKNELKTMKATFQTAARDELGGKEMKPATLEEATQAALR